MPRGRGARLSNHVHSPHWRGSCSVQFQRTQASRTAPQSAAQLKHHPVHSLNCNFTNNRVASISSGPPAETPPAHTTGRGPSVGIISLSLGLGSIASAHAAEDLLVGDGHAGNGDPKFGFKTPDPKSIKCRLFIVAARRVIIGRGLPYPVVTTPQPRQPNILGAKGVPMSQRTPSLPSPTSTAAHAALSKPPESSSALPADF